MSVSREKLHEEVWAGPMLKVATRYDVSSSFLARGMPTNECSLSAPKDVLTLHTRSSETHIRIDGCQFILIKDREPIPLT